MRFLRLTYVRKKPQPEIDTLTAQAEGSKKLHRTLIEFLNLKIAQLDSEMMSKSMFESVNSFSHKVANLTGARKELCDLIKLLEEVKENE